jgi:nitrogen-specific signal transduction histidine kinase
MELKLIATLPLWTINLALAGLVFFWHPRKPVNQAFAAFVLMIVGWSFSTTMFYVYATHPVQLLWGRAAFAAASLIGSTFVVFCHLFPDRQQPQLNQVCRAFMLSGTLLAGLSFTPLVLRALELSTSGGVRRAYGALYPLFIVFMLAAFSYGIWTLTRQWRLARGRSRLQIQYLSLGLGLFFCGGLITNLVIPTLLPSTRSGMYGPYFGLFIVSLTAHAIIRHRLMDIRVIIRQSITYALSAWVAVGIIWGLIRLMIQGLGLQVPASSAFLPLMIGVAGAMVFHPVRSAIQYLFDRYCYRHAYDYRQAIRSISQVLAGLLRIDPLCDHLTTFILQTLKVEEVAVYLSHDQSLIEQRSYQHVGKEEQPRTGPLMVISPHLIDLLARTRQPLVLDELTRWAEASELEHLREEFALLRSEVLVPLLVEQQVAGFISVGEKLSGDPLFSQDLEFLVTIGHQAAAALKRAQLHEEVSWMKEYNESILRHMESGLVVVNHDNTITVINEAAARMLETRITEVVGQPLEKLIPCGLGLPLLDTLLEKTTYTNHEAKLVTGSAQALPIVLSTSILHGGDAQPSGAILAFNDLSQIKVLEEEKRRIERLASIGAFMSGIAHEIKNPLVAIKTLAELLPEQYDDEEFRETFTKVTLNEVDRIDALVRRLRSLSSGSTVPLHPLNILTPLEETLSLVSGELLRHHITVIRDYQPAVPAVMGDHDQLKQVFVNICLNSVEAMGEVGTLRVTVESRGKPGGRSPELIIQIADTGPGIPSEHLASIFDPFFTLKEQGTGLGLAICRGIIDYHRGSISAGNSSEGSGAVFTVKLPVAQGVEAYESTVASGQQARTAHAVAEVARRDPHAVHS